MKKETKENIKNFLIAVIGIIIVIGVGYITASDIVTRAEYCKTHDYIEIYGEKVNCSEFINKTMNLNEVD